MYLSLVLSSIDSCFSSLLVSTACPANCSVCTSSECPACNPGFVLWNGACLLQCPLSTFNSSNVCQGQHSVKSYDQHSHFLALFFLFLLAACISNCQRCTDASTCEQCSIGSYTLNGVCVGSSCPVSTFANSSNTCAGLCMCTYSLSMPS